jgi:hypothetical protein
MCRNEKAPQSAGRKRLIGAYTLRLLHLEAVPDFFKIEHKPFNRTRTCDELLLFLNLPMDG